MWNFASKAFAGSMVTKNELPKLSHSDHECSDDEDTTCISKEEGLECPICWESFSILENVPYVLWCGHTLCKNCVMGLQWAVVNIPHLPIQLPLFISCPWCQLLSFRVVYNGVLKFPRKNYFLLWMVDSMNHEAKTKSCSHRSSHDHRRQRSITEHMHMEHSDADPDPDPDHLSNNTNFRSAERILSTIKMSLVFLLHLTAKFPLVVIFLLIMVYVVPASAIILALYILVTLLLAMPSFLLLYFAYPTLDWLAREIIT